MEKKIKKICFFSSTRADYGQLSWLIKDITYLNKFKVFLIVSGTHILKKYGYTYKEIQKDNLKNIFKINIFSEKDSLNTYEKISSVGINKFTKCLKKIKPDILFLMGDRFELLSIAQSAFFLDIPIAHIAGGESTFGSKDETVRNIITKFSFIHFVSNKLHQKKIIQLGENPKKVYNVGGLNVESILRTKVLDKNTLEKKLKFIFMKKNLLVTFHPETIDYNNSKRNFIQLIKALEKIKDILFIFTYPNADKKNNEIIKKINKFTRTYKNSVSFKSMGRINYISTLNYIDGVIGNSSSGITEAPSFKIGTINIGDRQEGRIKSSSIIDCKPKTSEILKAIKRLYSSEFKNMLKNSRNPYANGLVSNKIINILNKTKIPNNLKKIFYENS